MACDSLVLTQQRYSLESSDSVQSHLEIDDLSQFRNEGGCGEVRLGLVRAGLSIAASRDRELLTRAYEDWVLTDHYLTLKRTSLEDGSETYHAIKCRKRGNDVDAFRVSRAMRGLKDLVLPYTWDDEHEHGQFDSGRPRRTRALYVTGTIDPRLVDHDAESAWLYMGPWFNAFLANLRKRCGTVFCYVNAKGKMASRIIPAKISVIRSWESHKSGWPHFHAIVCFEDYWWGISFRDKNNNWRIRDKDRARPRAKDKSILDWGNEDATEDAPEDASADPDDVGGSILEAAWPYGHVDVIALTPGTTDKNIENTLWYVGKSLSDHDYRLVSSWPKKRLLGLSLMWYFRRRAFSISKALARARDDLTKRKCITQTTVEGNHVKIELYRWELIGLVRRIDTELRRDDWETVYDHPPDWLPSCWKPNEMRRGLWWGKCARYHDPRTAGRWGGA